MAGKITSAIISLISGGIVSVYSTKSLVSSINLQRSKITLHVTTILVSMKINAQVAALSREMGYNGTGMV